jgi:hypothetical protein
MWLADARPYSGQRGRREEWQSLKEDVTAAWDQAGPALRAVQPTMPTLLSRLRPDLGFDRQERAALRLVVEQVRVGARDPRAAAAAFDDLVTAVQDADTPTVAIAGRVDVLDSILRFADRALADVVHTLSGILNNDSWDVAATRHLLDGDVLPEYPIPRSDEDAGLSEEDRVALARRWLTYEPPPSRNVVWLFYGDARLDHWRLSIGPCEFFSGPALLAAMAEVDEIRAQGGDYPGTRDPFKSVPDELLGTGGHGLFVRDPKSWPDEDHWVAARVDLGTGRLPNLEQNARDQVGAVIALAAFAEHGTTWTPLTGYTAFRDGEPAGSSMPFHGRSGAKKWVQTDHTHEWLRRHADQIGRHVLTDADAHGVVEAATALNDCTNASPTVQILEAVRSIETLASVKRVRWKDLVKTHVIPGTALSATKKAAIDAISDLAGQYELYTQLPQLHRLTDEFIEPAEDGLRRLKIGEAFNRLRPLVDDLPTYNRSARRIRDLVSDLSTPTDAAAYIERHCKLDERLVGRAARVRNSLTHGGPKSAGVEAATAEFIVAKAQYLAGTTLRALLEGKPLADGPDDHQSAVDTCLERIPSARTTYEALYGPPSPTDAGAVDLPTGTPDVSERSRAGQAGGQG